MNKQDKSLATITTFKEVKHTQILLSLSDDVNIFKPIMAAFISHAVLILAIAWFWQQDSSQRKTTFIQSSKPDVIKSYLITSKQYQLMQDNHEKLNNTSSLVEHNLTNLSAPKAPPIPPKITVKKINNKPIKSNDAELKTKTNDKPNVKKVVSRSQSIQQASAKFIKQHNNDQLETLIGSQTAWQNKPVGTMSEMDSRLDFIVLSPEVDISQPHTFNHKLDPNRIVKQGDYCYTVVELATQINPHGYGLGYAEFCGEDKQQQLLTEMINNRISQIK